MEVSRAELVSMKGLFRFKGKRQLPHTFFSLNDSEQKLYDSFRTRHKNLEEVLNRMENRGVNTETREKGEKEVDEIFLELANPYLQRQGLKASRCFTTYGANPKTFLVMPHYLLFGNKEQSEPSIELNYFFSTEDKNLSCESNMSYLARNDNRSEELVIYDLLKKITDEKVQDGINFPIVSFIGHTIYFASTEFAVPLMHFVREVLTKIDSKFMEGLKVLHTEYMGQQSRGEFSDTTIQQKVFREAYERELEKALQIYRFHESLTRPVKRSETIQ